MPITSLRVIYGWKYSIPIVVLLTNSVKRWALPKSTSKE